MQNYFQNQPLESFKFSNSNVQALCYTKKVNNLVEISPEIFSLLSISKGKQQDIQDLNFSTLSYSVQQLSQFATKIISSSSYCKQHLNDKMINSLVIEFAKTYNAVSYHNFTHGFCLMLLAYQCFTRCPESKNILTEQEYCFLLIAALAHDLNHRTIISYLAGTNNLYQIKKKSQLALQSNNVAVLENMHLRTLWNIIQSNPNLDFMCNAEDKNRSKEFITRLILSTDMAQHSNNLLALKKINSQGMNKKDQQYKQIYLANFFHACDIGNGCADYDEYISWVALLTYQFKQQTEIQKNQGLQVTEMLTYKGLPSLYNGQVWFLSNIVLPLWKQLETSFIILQIFVNKINKNIEKVKEKANIAL